MPPHRSEDLGPPRGELHRDRIAVLTEADLEHPRDPRLRPPPPGAHPRAARRGRGGRVCRPSRGAQRPRAESRKTSPSLVLAFGRRPFCAGRRRADRNRRRGRRRRHGRPRPRGRDRQPRRAASWRSASSRARRACSSASPASRRRSPAEWRSYCASSRRALVCTRASSRSCCFAGGGRPAGSPQARSMRLRRWR